MGWRMMSEDPDATESAVELTGQAKSRLSIAQWIVRCAALLSVPFLLSGIGRTSADRAAIEDSLAAVQEQRGKNSNVLADLMQQKEHMESRAKQMTQMREKLRRIYSQYRDVDDIAENPSKLIIQTATSHNFNNSARFTVPEGKYRLAVQVIKTKPKEKTVLEEKSVEHELIGPGGYIVWLDHSGSPGSKYRDPRQLKLLITSNRSDFGGINEPLLEPFPPPNGSSSTGTDAPVISFPNQYRERWPKKPGDPIDTSLLLITNRLSARTAEEPKFDLSIEVKLYSGGPLCANPLTVQGFRYRKPKRFAASYVGSGKYELTELDISEETLQ